MARSITWEKNIGRRLRLRDLHLFFTVVHHGSMAKAATELGISQPSVSAQIAALEHALKVRLFDRSPQGVEPTQYGEALLARGQAAFDELRQGIRDIEFLSDAAVGEVRIGCSETICPGLLTPIIERLSLTHPRLNLKVEHIVANPPDLRGLQERRLDLVMGPFGKKLPSDYKAEILLNDSLRVVAGANSPWAARSKIEISELADERWIMQPPEAPAAASVAAAFRAIRRPMLKFYLEAYSIHLRNHLISTGRFIGIMATSVLRLNAQQLGLVALPVELPFADFPLGAITVKGRTLTPVVDVFLECAREVGKLMSAC